MIKLNIQKHPIAIRVNDPELLMNVFSNNQSLLELRYVILKEMNIDIENYTMKQIDELRSKLKDIKQKEKERKLKEESMKTSNIPKTNWEKTNTTTGGDIL